ncbi:MAG TPA: exodeoxyribonuclease V subunit gamma [Edaphocola sp.]|nr:exodeoxyribonuclease V subunit gamma [Edaphocola sp.]
MSISINISNDINELARVMTSQLNKNERNVFTPFFIVTQTDGMSEWLKIQIAEHLGIAANFQFLKPGHIVSLTYNILRKKYERPVHQKGLDWMIFSILNKENFKRRFPKQSEYYADSEQEDELKRWEFALKIADLLDQYQIYRSQMIHDWDEKELNELPDEQQWQAYIWKTLKKNNAFDILDITKMKREILEGLQEPEKQARIKETLPSLNLFGLSIITPFHLEIMHELSKHIEINWFISNPSPNDYWFEDESEKQVFLRMVKGKKYGHLIVGNELLTSWGKVLQDTFKMIFRSDDDFFNNLIDLPSKTEYPNTLLGSIQSDIYNNIVEPNVLEKQFLKDESIVITSNFSIFREVETVYNYILNTVLTKKNITERDIIVMVTDINAYAPFIRAVMDNAPYKFQYTITDEGEDQGETLSSALIKLLEFDTQLFAAKDVLNLLSSKIICKKFGITNLEFIRHAITKANIRFGIENDYQTKDIDTYLVSWKYGMQKLMYGLCMLGEQKMGGEKGFYTVESTDGNAEIQELLAFNAFLEVMFRFALQKDQPRNLANWRIFIEETLNDFLLSDYGESEEDITKVILKSIQNNEIEQHMDLELISFKVYSKKLINELSLEIRNNNIKNKGITFCSLLPFRSIPFKVVAILGLDYEKFPRKEQHLDFNLMSRTPKLGDRNIKNNDKHLFLESVLSAEEALYLSYIGKDAASNKRLPPSILIDELIDYIQLIIPDIDVAEELIQEHSLHSYSKRYNKKVGTLIPNYLMRGMSKWPVPILENPKEKNIETSFNIKDVANFFYKSIKYFYNKELGVYFENDETEIEDSEGFELTDLEKWKFNYGLVASIVGGDEKKWFEKEYLNAQLPLRNTAITLKKTTEEELQQIIMALKANFRSEQKFKPLKIHYEYKGFFFQGIIEQIIDKTVLHFEFKDKEVEGKTKLKLNYLWAKITDPEISEAQFYQSYKKYQINELSQEEVKQQLHQILDVFLECHHQAVFYNIKTYDNKMNEANFIEILKQKLVKVQDYQLELTHAKEWYSIQNQERYFSLINPVIETLLKNYE